MKPIKLEIAGLQSFIEKQTIDFSLASGSIFGIFGKTGSGKSTILDGVTLALFGYVSRISKNAEFINSKCNSCEVSLEFEEDDKKYYVKRVFKLKKNEGVDQSAILLNKTSDEPVTLAEGAFAVTNKIKEIVGLEPEEFCQIIALPQGKFAEFLQAKPSERTNLISNIFGINDYVEKLFSTVKRKSAAYENELNMLEAEKNGIGVVEKQEVQAKEDELKKEEQELKDIAAKIQEASNEYKTIVENASLKKDQVKLKSELEDLYKQSSEIKENKGDLIRYENAKNLDLYFGNYDKLLGQVKDLNREVDELRNEKIQRDASFRDFEEQYKRFDELQKHTLLDLESKKSRLLELGDDQLCIESGEKELERLKGELEEKNKTLQMNSESLAYVSSECVRVTNSLQELYSNKEKLEEQKSSKEQSLENKSVESEIILIESFERQLENVITGYREDINACRDEYSELAKKEREYNEKIAEIVNSVDRVCGKSDMPLVSRFRQSIENLSAMDNVQDKYDFLGKQNEKIKQEMTSILTKIKEIETENDKNHTLLQEKIQLVSKIENKLKTSQIEREEYIGDNYFGLLVQNVDIGDECPVCKNRVSRKSYAPLSDTKGLDSEIASIKTELQVARKEKENTIIACAKSVAKIDFYKSQLDLLAKKHAETEKVREKLYMMFVDNNGKQKENFASMQEAMHVACKSLEKLLSERNKLSDETLAITVQKTELGTRLQMLNECIEKVTDVLYSLEKQRAEREFILQATNESGDNYNSAAKQYNQIIDELDSINAEIRKLEQNKNDLMEEKLQLTKTEGEIVAEKQSISVKMDNVMSTINSKRLKFESQGFESNNCEKELEELKQKQEEITAKNNEFKNSYEQEKDKKISVEKEYNLKFSLLQEKNNDLRELDAKIDNLSRTYGFTSTDEAKNYLVSDLTISSLKTKVEEFERRVSVINLQLSSIDEKIGDKEIDVSRVDYLDEQIKMLREKQESKQIYLGVLQSECGELKTKLAKLEKIDAKLPELTKKYDLAKELYNLLRGKSLAEFMANEFIDMITTFANEKLQILDGGRYKLFYDEKDFYVEDNLNDGKKRAVSTLSGGETFLVSLSLALSMSDCIQLQSDKKMDFFFLDEGFGTLDSELCQTVLGALYKLRGVNLNIGLITHVQELQNEIQYKFIVTKASENSGSKVQFVTGL